jgi:hypothetical protein
VAELAKSPSKVVERSRSNRRSHPGSAASIRRRLRWRCHRLSVDRGREPVEERHVAEELHELRDAFAGEQPSRGGW